MLAARRELLGPNHGDTLRTLGNVAAAHWALGDPAGARAVMEEVLAAQREHLGPHHPDTLVTMGNLAAMEKTLGEPTRARALEEEVLATRRELLGPGHPATLGTTGNLADTLYKLDDPLGARALLEEALAAQRELLGASHPDTRWMMENLTVVLKALGDVKRAHALVQEFRGDRIEPVATETAGPDDTRQHPEADLRLEAGVATSRGGAAQAASVPRRLRLQIKPGEQLLLLHDAHLGSFEDLAGRPGTLLLTSDRVVFVPRRRLSLTGHLSVDRPKILTFDLVPKVYSNPATALFSQTTLKWFRSTDARQCLVCYFESDGAGSTDSRLIRLDGSTEGDGTIEQWVAIVGQPKR